MGREERGWNFLDIYLYKNKSDNNVVSKDLTQIAAKTNVKLKDQTTIINPAFVLSGLELPEIAECNYIYAPDLKRYYYINNISLGLGKMYIIDCHCDVLMSFKEQFLRKSAIIERQENKYNLYLNDNMYKVYNKDRVQLKKFTGQNDLSKNGFVLLGIVGGGN